MSGEENVEKTEKQEWTIIDKSVDPDGPLAITVDIAAKTKTIENCPEPGPAQVEKIVVFDSDKLAEKLINAGIIKDKSEIMKELEI